MYADTILINARTGKQLKTSVSQDVTKRNQMLKTAD